MNENATKARAKKLLNALQVAYPDAHCELLHKDPFQLLVATVLSAQTTDVVVNQVTPSLFRRWPNPRRLAAAELPAVELVLSRIGMYRQKARNIVGLSQKLLECHSGQVPMSLELLVQLPGVGRKTANVVLGVAFGRPEGVVVDTHVQRLSQRLGLTSSDHPEQIERDLMQLFPIAAWDNLSHTLIFHGRRCCTARKPACESCPIQALCPSAFNAENVGRKTARKRVSSKLPRR
jgi:endonuclease III